MKRFLLIDDEDIFNYLNSEIIQLVNKEYEHQMFTSAQDALAYLRSIGNQSSRMPDIILLDIRMPGMSGFDFLDALTLGSPIVLTNTAVYILSSSLDHRDMEKANTYPMVRGFRSKPLSEEMVKEMVLQ
ncbi:MAG: response regulator [Bacteroidia bacterium]|jgi:CheY-like chemotaxis protein